MAGKGGGAWKVAYADFVTAMMAFFMVMWLLSQDSKVKEAVASHFRDPHGEYDEGGNLLPPIYDLFPKDGLSPRPDDAHHKRARGPSKPSTDPDFATNRGERTRLGTVIMFGEDTAELSEAGEKKLADLVPMIAGKPQKIEIRGHALEAPLPPESPYRNAWELSYARCQAAMRRLEQQGIPPERIRLSQAGPYEPFTIGADPQRLANNSCVEVFLLSEMTAAFLGTAEERAKRFVDE